jgi:hypothetical protein
MSPPLILFSLRPAYACFGGLVSAAVTSVTTPLTAYRRHNQSIRDLRILQPWFAARLVAKAADPALPDLVERQGQDWAS